MNHNEWNNVSLEVICLLHETAGITLTIENGAITSAHIEEVIA